MQRIVLRSKIHGATVTQTELHYGGSLTLDRDLMDAADMLENERVQIVNLSNGSRIETYVIAGERGSGVVCLNGPAARAGAVGDTVHILCYGVCGDDEARALRPAIVILGPGNQIAQLP